jgi:glycine cleavage system H protein
MSDLPADLRYTREHEWARAASGEVTVGITAFAVEQLGDITLVNLDVKAGDTVEVGKAFGTIESVKTLSDLFAPVSGKVVRVNAELATRPELVNEDCYGKAWMVAIAPADAKAVESLLDSKAYAEYLKTAAH